jgi:hypothetical protein
MKIRNDNGLLVNEEDGRLVGYLFNFQGHGIFAPDGKVEVTPAEMETHNRLLSEAEIKGLDENCQVGQGGMFYYNQKENTVKTFTGTVVSSEVTVKGNSITFMRGRKKYSGRLQKDADCFNFRRTF